MRIVTHHRPRHRRAPLDDLALLLDELERDVARLVEAPDPVRALVVALSRSMDLLRRFAARTSRAA